MKKKPILYKIDFLTSQPTLFVFGEDKNQTKIGAIMSLLVVLSSLGLGIYFFYRFLIHSDLGLVYMKETKEFFPQFNLSESLFSFGLEGDFDDTVFKIYPRYITNNNGNITEKLIPYEDCKSEFLPKRFQKGTEELFKNVKCFNPKENVTIENNINSGISKNLVIDVRLCDSSRNPACKPREEIEELLIGQNIQLSFMFESSHIDHFNKSNPIQATHFIQSASLNIATSIINQYYWLMINYKSDEGFIFENIKTRKGIIFENTFLSSTIYDRNPTNWNMPRIGYFQFSVYPYYGEKYTRTYSKIQSVIADVGGIISVVQIIGGIIVNLFSNNIMYAELGKHVLNDQKTSSSIKKIVNLRQGLLSKNHIKKKETPSENSKKAKNQENFIQNSEKQIKKKNHKRGKSNEIQRVEKDINLMDSIPSIITKNSSYKTSEEIQNTYKEIKNETKKTDYEENNNILISEKAIKDQSKLQEIPKKRNFFISRQISIKDFFLYNFGFKKSKGTELLQLCEKISKDSLSCEQLIKNNISIQKLIKLLDDKQKLQFYQIKPELIKELEEKNKISHNLIEKTEKKD